MTGTRLELLVASRAASPRGDTVVKRATTFDLDDLVRAELPLTAFAAEFQGDAVPPPNSVNRLDLLIMGDGYTAAQSATFSANAATLAGTFFGISPYSVYQNFVNTARLFTASTQSGADHPPFLASCPGGFPTTCCADAAALSDPLAGTFVNTAFDASFCAFNIHRLLVVNGSKVLTAAGPPRLGRDPRRRERHHVRGSGREPLRRVHPRLAVGIAQHEFGHTFTGLADEYSSPFPGYPPCSDITAIADCEPNVTDQTTRALIKWNPWIEPSTPVPTPTTGFVDKVGLFQGARYLSFGMYRPQQSCLMNTLGTAFCRVCAQEYVRRLYTGGWGVPAAGIDNIEPGSESPAPGLVTITGAQTFNVGLLSPSGGPPLSVSWPVNGVVQPGATGGTFNYLPTAPGTYMVQVRTKDVTTLVNPAMAGGLLDSSRTWTVAVQPGADLQVTQTGSAGVAMQSQPFTFTVVVRNNGPNPVTAATVQDTAPSGLTGVTWTCAASAGSACTAAGAGTFTDSAVNLLIGGTATYTITGTVGAAARGQIANIATVTSPAAVLDATPANNTSGLAVPIFKNLSYHTVTPCRLVDTRNPPVGGLGGPALVAGADRTFTLFGLCNVSPTAWALSVNVTVTAPTASGNLRLYPAENPLPFVSTINYGAGQTRGNNAIVTLGPSFSQLTARVAQPSGTVHFILDVTGYFE